MQESSKKAYKYKEGVSEREGVIHTRLDKNCGEITLDFREIKRTKSGTQYKWLDSIGGIVYCYIKGEEYKLMIRDCYRRHGKPRVVLNCVNEGWNEIDFELDTTHLQNCYVNSLINNVYANPKHRWMLKYMSVEDAKKSRYASKHKLECTCPNCGHKKLIAPATLSSQGLGCIICGDGVSFPEKVIGNILKQLGIHFKNQFSFNKKEKYDFYFVLNKEKYIIEAHGGQHYSGGFERAGGKDLMGEQRNDRLKYELALLNGIKEENYIVIDCRFSQLGWIMDSIKSTKLSKLLDLDKVDMKALGDYVEGSLMKNAISLYVNEGLNTVQLSERLSVSPSTISIYLKRGEELGWCISPTTKHKEIMRNVCEYFNLYRESAVTISKVFDINPKTVYTYLKQGTELGLCKYDEVTKKEIATKSAKIRSANRTKPVKATDVKTGEVIVFSSVIVASKWHGRISQGAIRDSCIKTAKPAYGYIWSYISKEEFEILRCQQPLNPIPREHPSLNGAKRVQGVHRETGEVLVFPSIAKATNWLRETGIGGSVQACCAGKTSQAGGYIWSYIDDVEETGNQTQSN